VSDRAPLWLRADAVFDAGMGILLLMASWDTLYEALGLPLAVPAMYAQVAGGLLLGYAYLLWTGAEAPGVRRLAGTTAVVNVAGVVVLGIWLLSGELGAETLGELILWAAVVALAAFAIAEAGIARGTRP
jgi:hypothetical protein